MVKSMTGYGSAKGTAGGLAITVELRSLNSKFLELGFRLPSTFRDKELEMRAEIGKQIDRGKADIIINYENNDLAKRSTVNREIFAGYYNELKSLADEFKLDQQNLLDTILKLPAVLNTDKTESDDQQWKELKVLIYEALEQFNAFRVNEGKALEKDIISRIKSITGAITVLESMEQNRLDGIRQRLQKGLSEISNLVNTDENRFEQELIYYIEKLDISEEKVRLKSHCEYFMQTIALPEANGKKLGFITQEIGREINTIGSKANDATMQRTVVEMKDELEKLKEQLANVL